MRLLDWVAAIVLLCQLPIPLFWLIVHPQVGFWRRHIGVAYLVAVLSAWGGVAVFVYLFHERLFLSERGPAGAKAVGVALIAADLYVLYRVERGLGATLLTAHAAVTGR